MGETLPDSCTLHDQRMVDMEGAATPNLVARQTPQIRTMKNYGTKKGKSYGGDKCAKKPRGKNPRRKEREMR